MDENEDLQQRQIHIPSRIFDMILMSIFTFLCTIPVVTFGAGIAALGQSVRHVQADEFFEPGTFFRYFRKTWKTATAIWILLLVAGVILTLDLRLVLQMTGLLRVLLLAGLFCILCCGWAVFATAFLLLAQQPELTVHELLPRAFLTGMSRFPRTLLILLLAVFPLAFFAVSPTVFWVVSPLWIFAWPAGAMFVAVKLIKLS